METRTCLLESHELDEIACLVQSTGEVKKDLPFIVNHENLNLTGIRRLLRKSKVSLGFFILDYFLTLLELVILINRNKAIGHTDKFVMIHNELHCHFNFTSGLQPTNQHGNQRYRGLLVI